MTFIRTHPHYIGLYIGMYDLSGVKDNETESD